MRKFKTILILLLIFCMVFAFSACGSKVSGGSDGSGDSDTQDQEQTQDQDDLIVDEDDPDAEDFWEDDWDEDGWDDDEDADGDGIKDSEQISDEDSDDDGSGDGAGMILPTDLTGDYTGQFSSDTGTALNLIVQWAADKQSDGNYKVTCGFYVDSYSLWTSDRSGNTLTVETSGGTKELTFTTKEINKQDNVREQLLVGSTSFTLTEAELNAGAKVTAVWDYRGTYSGTDLPTITAEGMIIKV